MPAESLQGYVYIHLVGQARCMTTAEGRCVLLPVVARLPLTLCCCQPGISLLWVVTIVQLWRQMYWRGRLVCRMLLAIRLSWG